MYDLTCRMRTLHHAVIAKQALQPLPGRKVAPEAEAAAGPGSSQDWSMRLGKQRTAASKARGYRCV